MSKSKKTQKKLYLQKTTIKKGIKSNDYPSFNVVIVYVL